MILVAFIAVASARFVITTIGHRKCAISNELRLKFTNITSNMYVELHNASELSSKLFTDARRFSRTSMSDGVIFADCASQNIGISFRNFTVGMDCSMNKFAELKQKFPKKPDFLEFLFQVTEYANDEWIRKRECVVWDERILAFLFWLGVAIILRVFFLVRFAVQKRMKQY